ncbi:hypothetical protein GCM10010112_12220 [Actinoplanes lobatus]|uniref:Uncharacterized protein n=1 Tax=Actinoplanes lobatus TaxID=113568 RepID=A0A7W7HDV7_9ACTN|nr:hypothetical protein [Actinoplanes lobatus]MBB4748685.1 hypothetical protein [Actinoplanes lobatus]GGN58412.1 hypothetical protein GCM10010112_12220 [Actinoplanes lobatus]GIE37413.1 hypothetical protein Alo02nite_03110 [Actinoplanes lobatus]
MSTAGRLAVVAPRTGPRARWGRLFPPALLEHPAVEVFDDAADPERSVAIARRIAGSAGYSAVVGHFSSEAAGGALTAYRWAGIPVAFPLSSAPEITREHLDPDPGVIAPMPDNLAQAAVLFRAYRPAEAWAGPSADGLAGAWELLGGRVRPSVREILQQPGAGTLVVLGTLTDAEEAMRAVAEDGREVHVALTDDSWVGSPDWDELPPGERPRVVTSRPDPAVLVDRCARHMLEAVERDLTGPELVTLWAERYGVPVWEQPRPVEVLR